MIYKYVKFIIDVEENGFCLIIELHFYIHILFPQWKNRHVTTVVYVVYSGITRRVAGIVLQIFYGWGLNKMLFLSQETSSARIPKFMVETVG